MSYTVICYIMLVIRSFTEIKIETNERKYIKARFYRNIWDYLNKYYWNVSFSQQSAIFFIHLRFSLSASIKNIFYNFNDY